MTYFITESQEENNRVTDAVKMAVLLRALRNAFAMSQSELAEEAGSSRPTLNLIETMDKRSVRSNTLDALLQIFRDGGVEITVGDVELNIRFTKKALIAAGKAIQSNSVKNDINKIKGLSWK